MRVRIHLACPENRRCSVPFCAGTARLRTGEDAGDVAWALVVRGRRRPGVRGGEAKHREGGENRGVKQQKVEGGGGMSGGRGRGKGGEEIRPSGFTVLPFPSLYHLCDSPNLTLLV